MRAPGEQRRYVASQRSARIDPNPHQIDAVIFALKRIPEGGCILADEVGLGKTIEAGLVIAQLLAEGKERVLLITPKALLGQWRQELFSLFSITAMEANSAAELSGTGVFLVTRDFAGGERGSDAIREVPLFDLCVIDEAHEIFAGVYRRFDKMGNYQTESKHARMAGRVRDVLRDTPMLLLTATPIQNSLTELWGLAQYVEPTGTLLGNLRTFREMFCAGDDRRLVEGQAAELQRRVAEICQRTLRRQAQEFMTRPFVGRKARLFEYNMSPQERALYDDVTEYLLDPVICAFRGNQRQLLLIGFHRRMASSVPALAASLSKVAERLEKMLEGASADEEETAAALLEDLEEDDLDLDADDVVDESRAPSPEMITAELARVRAFVERATSLPSDAKAHALVRAVRTVLKQGEDGEGSGKVVVFTESITTQNYLREVLCESGLLTAQDVTLFRGTNDGARAQEAVARWREEELPNLAKTAQPSPDIAVRLALVHEFRTRSKVFISTEAGAKGLNLQFAGTLINYDLPWNPQRIEQRIGRIHRYGQTKDVLVINFAAHGNEAQKLTLEILTRKLDLFGTVLGASDEVLHDGERASSEVVAGALSADFEKKLRRIYERARTQKEIESELIALREEMDGKRERFESTHERTAGLIESRFDDEVKKAFRDIEKTLPADLAAFDDELEEVVVDYLNAASAEFTKVEVEAGTQLHVASCATLPAELQKGFIAHLGDARGVEGVEPLHMAHPLVAAALADARASTATEQLVHIIAPPGMNPGQRGRLQLVKVSHAGFEPFEMLLPIALMEGSEDPISPEAAAALLSSGASDAAVDVDVDDEDMEDALEEALFDLQAPVSEREQEQFSKAVSRIEMSVEDRALLVEREREEQRTKVAAAERLRDSSVGADSRTKAEAALKRQAAKMEVIEAELERLRRRDDESYTRWMKRANDRYSRAPAVETLMDIRFELVGADA